MDPALKIEVLSPPSIYLDHDDCNTNSVVLKATYGSEVFLFVGDATTINSTL